MAKKPVDVAELAMGSGSARKKATESIKNNFHVKPAKKGISMKVTKKNEDEEEGEQPSEKLIAKPKKGISMKVTKKC